MERVAFLLESTGERIACMLNPETLVIRRNAGVRARRGASGPVTGAGLADDPLVHTGGGRTELELDLLFDVTLTDTGGPGPVEDVRELTGPLWDLAENRVEEDGAVGRLAVVRFVWGKTWNIPGVISAVAERLEHFTPTGVPRRSWLRMRLLRVGEPVRPRRLAGQVVAAPELTADNLASLPPEQVREVRMVGDGSRTVGASGGRLDSVLYDAGISPSEWKPVAEFNGIDNPFRIAAGAVLRVPAQVRAMG
jgi:hypothetical protein